MEVTVTLLSEANSFLRCFYQVLNIKHKKDQMTFQNEYIINKKTKYYNNNVVFMTKGI